MRFIEGSILDRDKLAEATRTVDGIVHLAAIASVQKCNEDWFESHLVNVSGTVRVFEAARDRGGIPVVYASSAAVYGDHPDMPLQEASAGRPLTAYGADKFGCELHARSAGLVHGVPSFGLRFFNVFGPRQDPSSPYSGVISIFLDRLLKGQSVTVFGDGGQVRDFVYVGDVVRHILSALERADATAPVANVCTGNPTSVLELAGLLGEITGCNAPIMFAPARPGDIQQSIGSSQHASARLNLSASMSLRQGLGALNDYASKQVMAA